MLGTIANVAAIAAGVVVGLAVRRGISEKIQTTIMQGLGLVVLLVGLKMAWQTQNEIILILSLAAGAVLGGYIDIENKLNAFGKWLENKVGSRRRGVSKAFITASLIYCVGAMTIMGSIEDGLTGEPKVLYIKSMLDGIASIIFTVAMGVGVILSIIPVFIIQGSITLFAESIKEILTDNMVAEMNAVGGLLIVGIAFNLLGIKKINVVNLLPAVPLVLLFIWLADKLS